MPKLSEMLRQGQGMADQIRGMDMEPTPQPSFDEQMQGIMGVIRNEVNQFASQFLEEKLSELVKTLRGPKGEKGEKGLPGVGKDGKDGTLITARQIVQKLESLVGNMRLSASAIKDLPEIETKLGGAIRSRSMLRGGGGSSLTGLITPTGTVDGVNTTFTLPATPRTNGLLFFVNGQLMAPASVDYALSGITVTTVTAPPTGSVVRALIIK